MNIRGRPDEARGRSIPDTTRQGEFRMDDHGTTSMNFVIQHDEYGWKVFYSPGMSMQTTSHELQEFVLWAAPKVEKCIKDLLKEKFPKR